MRFPVLLALALALLGCGRNALPVPAGDMSGGARADLRGARVCGSTCSQCPNGACCFGSCCAAGEWCDADTRSCRCGDGPACSGGNLCATGGPIGPGADGCGSICCGRPGMPCPL